MCATKLVNRRRVERIDFSKYKKTFGDGDGWSAGREILRRLRIAANLANSEQSPEIKERNIALLEGLLKNPTHGEPEGMTRDFKVYPGESYLAQYMRQRDLVDLGRECADDMPFDARVNDCNVFKNGGFFYEGTIYLKIDFRGSLEEIAAAVYTLAKEAKEEFGCGTDRISSAESLRTELRYIERILAEYDRRLLKDAGLVDQTQEDLASDIYHGGDSARTSLRDLYVKYSPIFMRDDYAFRLQFRCLSLGG